MFKLLPFIVVHNEIKVGQLIFSLLSLLLSPPVPAASFLVSGLNKIFRFHAGDPNKVKAMVKTKKEFGKVPFNKFDIYKED